MSQNLTHNPHNYWLILYQFFVFTQNLKQSHSQRELAKKAQGKSIVHIHNEEIKNLVVPFPTKAEQNKIVEYFSSLDNLITLHQQQYQKLFQ